VTFKDGKKEGLDTEWWPNGKLKHTWTWKDGKKDGLYTTWYGRVYKIEQKQTKQVEGTVKDGNADGKDASHKGGKIAGFEKDSEQTWKNGKEDGLYTSWYRNGQKRYESTFKDGKLDGLSTSWYRNGQKKLEATFNSGKLISQVCWDEDENKCECSEKWWEGCK
jgi:antitoxin component YwqK of YwqJK toxin-antitoxin module